MARGILIAIILCGAATGVVAEPYRIVVLPDIQIADTLWPELVPAMTEWVVDNKDAMRIKYVLQVGDMVTTASEEWQWQNASDGLGVMDGEIPYIVCVGNRDMDSADNWNRTNFNTYFPVSRFSGLPSFGESERPSVNDSSYHTFRAARTDWLIVSLRYNPSSGTLAWARDVVESHPDHQVILLTHAYLSLSARLDVGENIWNNLAKLYENVSMVCCGHTGTLHRVSVGDHGNTVYEMAFDWEHPVIKDRNSYLAVLTLDAEAETISVESYSPYLDQYLTGAKAEFTFTDVSFMSLPSVPGDVDLDGFVDDADLSIVLANWGSRADLWTDGELTGSRPIDDSDLSLVLANWTGSAPASSTIPEPATLWMLAMGGGLALRKRRKYKLAS